MSMSCRAIRPVTGAFACWRAMPAGSSFLGHPEQRHQVFGIGVSISVTTTSQVSGLGSTVPASAPLWSCQTSYGEATSRANSSCPGILLRPWGTISAGMRPAAAGHAPIQRIQSTGATFRVLYDWHSVCLGRRHEVRSRGHPGGARACAPRRLRVVVAPGGASRDAVQDHNVRRPFRPWRCRNPARRPALGLGDGTHKCGWKSAI